MRVHGGWGAALAATAWLAAGAAAGPAGAAVVTYTYVGTFDDGTDETGVFGPAGRFLGDLAFTARFWRDDAAPGAFISNDGEESFVQGSSPPGQPLRASITVDGVTWNFAPGYGIQDQQQFIDACGPGCDYELFQHRVESEVNGFDASGVILSIDQSVLNLTGEGLGSDFLSGVDYHTLGSLGGGAVPSPFGYVDINALTFDTSIPDYTSQSRAYGHFTWTSLSVSDAGGAGVPEPASWALMILGFGGMGAALRRRRAGVA